MAGTVTLEEIVNGSIKRLTFTWTSDSSGNATKTTTVSYTGALTSAIFVPGTPTPTTAYDVVLNNTAAADMLGGAGANLSSSATVYKAATDGLTSVSASTLALSISNAGDSKQGTIIVYIFGTSNSYCTLAQVQNRLNPLGMTANTTDDSVIVDMIEQASQAIDTFCGGRTFYARTETRYFNVSPGRQLDLDDDLLSITTLTNGDANTIASTEYNLVEKNLAPYHAIRLKESSSTIWQLDTDGNSEWVISVLGTWGYVDRAGTAVRDTRVIRVTEAAAIAIVVNEYHKRYGEKTGGVATVTAAGVVITPDDIPAIHRKALEIYCKGNSAG